MDINILTIHTKICDYFNEEIDNIDNYRNKLSELNRIMGIRNISQSTKNNIKKNIELLTEKIDKLENKTSLNFYIMDSTDIIEEYKKIIDSPKKISFFGNAVINSSNREQNNELINKYISILKKYDLDHYVHTSEKKDKNTTKKYKCAVCNNKTDFEIIDTRIYVCYSCGYQIEDIGNSMSYHDVSRVNMSSKYSYERRVHFRDCINQYQGKQNSTISDKVYKELEEQFRLHGLLVESNNPKEIFKNITKDNILLFLKELGYTKHYEDVFLIYYKMTDKLPDDISYLERKLMGDFDILSNLYDQKFKQTKRIDRKNFINTQYVLYQLLRKYKHPCKKEDFNILKTLDRKSFHDEICLELFTELGWNFTPFF